MKKLKLSARLIAFTGLMSLAVTGAAYAALVSLPSTVKGNTIQTANASLMLSTDNLNFSMSLNGFAFNGLLPGGSPLPSPGYQIYMRNSGTANIATRVAIGKPITNAQNVDLSKVHLILSPTTGGVPQNITFQDMLNGPVALTNGTASKLTPGQSMGYFLQVSMDADAVSGASASLSDVDFSFSATSVN